MNRKYLAIGVGAVLVAIIIFIILAILNLGSIIKVAVEEAGPTLTKSEVKLSSADISFLSGAGELDGLYIGNPKGFTAPDALKVGTIKMTVDKNSLTSDKIIIKEIVILSPEITYETKGKTNNFNALIANVNKAIAGEEKQAKTSSQSEGEAGSQKTVQINNLIIKNGKVNVAGGLLKAFGDKGMGIDLPDIHLKDIGKKKETSPAEAFALVLGEMTKGIGSSVTSVAKTLQDTLKKGIEAGSGTVDSVTKGIKGLFGGDE